MVTAGPRGTAAPSGCVLCGLPSPGRGRTALRDAHTGLLDARDRHSEAGTSLLRKDTSPGQPVRTRNPPAWDTEQPEGRAPQPGTRHLVAGSRVAATGGNSSWLCSGQKCPVMVLFLETMAGSDPCPGHKQGLGGIKRGSWACAFSGTRPSRALGVRGRDWGPVLGPGPYGDSLPATPGTGDAGPGPSAPWTRGPGAACAPPGSPTRSRPRPRPSGPHPGQRLPDRLVRLNHGSCLVRCR